MNKRIKSFDFEEYEDLEENERYAKIEDYYKNKYLPRYDLMTLTCLVCDSVDIKLEDMYIAPCGHCFCSECWKDTFRVHTKTSSERFRCMAPNCKQIIPTEDIYLNDIHNGNLKLLKNYEFQVFLNENRDNLCQCPKCENKNLFEEGQDEVICSKCQHHICSKCSKDYHPGKPCEDKNNEELIWSDKLKPCPQCRTPFLKPAGCPFLKCPQCHTNFCWICMQVTDDHKHKPGQECVPHGDLNKK